MSRLLAAGLLISAMATAQGSVRLQLSGSNVGDEFGSVIAGLGDIDADGHADVIVGAPFDLPASGNPGSATAYSGLDGSVLLTLAGSAPAQAFGFGAASSGDVNGDGIPDIIIGVSTNGSTGLGPGGGAKIFSGADGSLLRTFVGTLMGDGFGQTVAGLGDINGDGAGDVIIGTSFAPNAAQPGYAKVFSGANGTLLYTKSGTFFGERFGVVNSAGDVNGDGIGDFIIGAISNNATGLGSGSAFVYSGATGALLYSFHGVAAGHHFGYAVAGLGDINGDGFGEVIVGTFIPSGLGYARVFSGANGSILYHLTDGVIGDAFGHTVSGIGDVNGDGTPDFAVSAPNSNVNGTVSGFVRVYSGATGAIIKDFVGSIPGIHFGYSVNPVGDVNGDALPDIGVGCLVPSALGFPGSATVVSICAAQPYGTALLPTQTLSLSWINGAPGHEAEGGPGISGAAPNAAGVLGVNLLPGQVTMLDVPVLIDLAPTLMAFDVFYGANGYLEFGVNLREPALSGVSLYLQAFEYNATAPQGVFASNGLMMLFGS